jgi:fatty acid desaturase
VQTATLREAGPCDFRTLSMNVRQAGLLDRRLGYYWVKLVLTVAAFTGGWVGLFLLRNTWSVLGIAVVLGLISTQLGFIGHDAGHKQVFKSQQANRLLGLTVGNGLIGLSYGWWVPKHNAHHAHPNQMELDPDIGVGVFGPVADEETGMQRGIAGWLERWQAQLLFPLMLLRSTGLYVSGAQYVIRRRDRSALGEGALLAMHATLYLTAVFWVLSPVKAIAFIAVNQAVFSLYLGCSFAPNHKGMPLIERDSQLGFARQQVITARNVSGGRLVAFMLGGLNYQIEHHLFPTMPRPNLRRAQEMVRQFCAENGLTYCEETPITSYRQTVQHLRLA